jgi:hypothetical protein
MSSHQITHIQPNPLSVLPFYNITNIELYNTIETIESHIKACLQDKNFPMHLQSTLPDSLILKHPCKYYTTDEYFTLNNKTTNTNIKLLHHNIRSLDAHYGELLALNSLMGGDFDFIALTEIGPTNLDSRRATLLRDMGCNFKFDPPKSNKGGAGLIYNQNLNLTERKDLKLISKQIGNSELNIENIWFETHFSNAKDNYIIGVIYRHPGSSLECVDDFSKQLEDIMIKINREKKKCIITGD